MDMVMFYSVLITLLPLGALVFLVAWAYTWAEDTFDWLWPAYAAAALVTIFGMAVYAAVIPQLLRSV